jgi:DNA-binding transcriptional ArsR family regulator
MTALYQSRELATNIAEKLKVYAQPQRLMILSCLLRGERNVAEIGEATGIGQPALSQQLAELRRAELASTRKEAKQVWYALADDGVRICVQTMESIFGGPELDQKLTIDMTATGPEPTPCGVAAFAQIVTKRGVHRAIAKK